jgi:L-threonylcarbamoyladenylate synthase
MAEQYGSFKPTIKKLAKTFWPGPLTLLVPKATALPDVLTAASPLVGIRVPDHAFCRDVVSMFGKPITSTSANTSGQQPATTVDEIIKTFGDNANDIDLVIEETDRVIDDPTPSTLVKVEGEQVAVLREGVISKEAIYNKIFT